MVCSFICALFKKLVDVDHSFQSILFQRGITSQLLEAKHGSHLVTTNVVDVSAIEEELLVFRCQAPPTASYPMRRVQYHEFWWRDPMWRALEVGRIGRVCRPNISCKVLPIWPVQAQVCHPLSHHCCRGCVEQLECRHTSRAAVACVHHDIEAVLMMQFIERQPPFQVNESRHALVGLCYDDIGQNWQVKSSRSNDFGVDLVAKKCNERMQGSY